MDDNALFDLCGRDQLVEWAQMMLGDEKASRPWVTLTLADLSQLPPLFVQISELEVLRTQIEAFAKKARAQSVEVVVDLREGMFHDFQNMASICPEAAPAIAALTNFLDQRLGAPS